MEEKYSLRERVLWPLSAYSRRISQWAERKAVTAREARRTRDKVKNPGILTPEQVRRVREFWAPYGKVDPIFHAYFTEKTGVFDPAYLPMDLYHTIIIPVLNRRPQYMALANKGLFRMFLGHVGIRQPATLCRRTDGLFYDAADNPISADCAVDIIVRAGRAFVKKAVDTWGGLGVVAYDSAEMPPEALREVVGRMGRDWIAQEPVEQCDEFNRLNPNSVNTLRIMSYLHSDGSVMVIPAALRMSRDRTKVDNGCSGGLSVGVLPNGRLKDVAHTINGDGFDIHPLTGTRFSDIVVPGYSRIQQQVRDAHARVPQFRLIAWDIAIDRNNEAVLIEINTNGDLNITQLNNGPLFGSRTREILDEIFGINH